MGQRNRTVDLEMEQQQSQASLQPEPCILLGSFPQQPDINNIPAMVANVPNLEPHSLQDPAYDNSAMFYGLPQYHHHPHQRAPTNFYVPYVAFQAPPGQLPSSSNHGVVGVSPDHEYERNAHFMDHTRGTYKRKNAEGIPGQPPYLSTLAAPFNTPETIAPFGGARNRPGAVTVNPVPPLHAPNNFIPGNYAGHHPFPPPGSTWYEQHCNSSRSDGSSSHWSQAPPAPYMPGNVVPGSIDSGNVCFPRYHETSSSRNPTPPFVYPRNHYISNHPVPPPPIVYPHMPSASYTETMHATSYTHVGPVQSTGLRINQQYPREDYVPGAILRHHGFPHLRAIPTDEVALWEAGEFYDDDDYVDDHQAMRLDIEDMSYEELLALSDQIGTVKTGLSEEDVKDLLKRKTSLATRINLEEAPSTDLESDSCTICQENYKHKDKIATLDCKHEYHTECLQKWLVIKNVCPICKSEALVMEKKKKLRLSSIGEEVTTDSN